MSRINLGVANIFAVAIASFALCAHASAGVVLDFTDTGASPFVTGLVGGTGTLADPLVFQPNTTLTLQVWARDTPGAPDITPPAGGTKEPILSYSVDGAITGGGPASFPAGAFTVASPPFNDFGSSSSAAAFTGIGSDANFTAGPENFGNANGGVLLGSVTVNIGAAAGISQIQYTESAGTPDDWGFLAGDGVVAASRILHITAVPEPSAWLCLGMIAAIFSGRTWVRRWRSAN